MLLLFVWRRLVLKYDVFISCKCKNLNGRGKTHDYDLAKILRDRLLVNGINAFLSDDDDLSKSNVKKRVDKAMEEATVMVVVSTSLEHIESEWVKYEWLTFQVSTLNGEKNNGKIITCVENMDVSDLPISLRTWQSYSLNKTDDIVRFVRKHLISTK